jgi:radical SAM protein with 4Fe4S-binding SPASM domain
MTRFRRVNVEITNMCNLQCSFCPEVERPKQLMSPELFRQVMTEIAPVTDEVCLHIMGEPLGHPELGALLQICADVAVPVNLTTNGLLLTGLRRSQALLPIVRQINFSVHSFAANFPGRDPSPYLAKLFAFAREAADRRPDLYVNYRLWDEGDAASSGPDGRRVRALIAAEYGVDLDSLQLNLARRKGYRLAGRVYVNFDSRFVWPSLTAPDRGARGTCLGLSNHIGIQADGTVVPCCLDKEAVLRLGRIGDQPLPEILDNPRAVSMREGFAANELREELCRRCSFIARFDKRAGRQGTAASARAPDQRRGRGEGQ